MWVKNVLRTQWLLSAFIPKIPELQARTKPPWVFRAIVKIQKNGLCPYGQNSLSHERELSKPNKASMNAIESEIIWWQTKKNKKFNLANIITMQNKERGKRNAQCGQKV